MRKIKIYFLITFLLLTFFFININFINKKVTDLILNNSKECLTYYKPESIILACNNYKNFYKFYSQNKNKLLFKKIKLRTHNFRNEKEIIITILYEIIK